MRVVGWVPVPKAMPGSSRITRSAAAGGSCQLGTIQNSGVMGTGSNWRLRDAHPVLVGHGLHGLHLQADGPVLRQQQRRGSPRPGPRRRTARSVDRCQPPARRRHAGLAEQGLLASVSASASSTDTDSASSSSISASLTGSTSGLRRRAAPVRTSLACGPRLSGLCWPSSLPGSGCWCRLRRTWRPPSVRGAAGCWSGCLRPRSPTARCACAPAPARACRRAR
jgi:hypothetical protein